jgi:hypothetical protein
LSARLNTSSGAGQQVARLVSVLAIDQPGQLADAAAFAEAP